MDNFPPGMCSFLPPSFSVYSHSQVNRSKIHPMSLEYMCVHILYVY